MREADQEDEGESGMSIDRNKTESSLGYVETEGPDGHKRLYVAAIFGDGGLIVCDGDWGEFGMVQILASTKINKPGPVPSKEEAIANIAPNPGVMLLFRKESDVERMIDTLQKVIERFPKPVRDDQP